MKSKVSQLEQQIRDEMNGCIHFKGIQHDLCGAGVNMRELVGGDDFGWAMRIPCLLIDSFTCTVTCAFRELPTREQAEATVAKHNLQFERTMKAVEAAHTHAKEKGLGQGRGGYGSLLCPLGCGGMLRYTVASVNGHMYAECGCVSWME